MRFFISHKFPSFNDYISAMNRNRFKGNQMKQELTSLVAWECRKNKVKKFNQVKIYFKWIEKNRRRDPDNLTANSKFVLDGLVRAGVIKDDGWDYVKGLYHDWEIGKGYGVEIKIEEVTE